MIPCRKFSYSSIYREVIQKFRNLTSYSSIDEPYGASYIVKINLETRKTNLLYYSIIKL